LLYAKKHMPYWQVTILALLIPLSLFLILPASVVHSLQKMLNKKRYGV